MTTSTHDAKYRTDIDGLRALAILGVVLYHAFPGAVSGGFFGVDVFFVISGYLISGVILRQLKAGQFSFLDFYRRRIRRIFPALSIVLICVLIAGWFICFSTDFARLGMHVAAGSTFAANLIFWREAGYFDISSELKPLLNLWSLGIEEQFYIFWPLALGLCWKAFQRNLTLFIITILLASMTLNLYLATNNPEAAFYSTLSRSWELMAGALLVGATRNDVLKLPTWVNEMVAGFGVGLLLASFLLLGKSDVFPGWYTLPVLGTGLLIISGPRTWLHRCVLSSNPLVWIGLISYPLYLWHWPLFSFSRILLRETPSVITFFVLIMASVLLAWATYRFAELPLRYSKNIRMPWLLATLVAAAGLFGGIAKFAHGFPQRLAIGTLKGPSWSHPVHDPGYEKSALAKSVYGNDFDSVRDFFTVQHGGNEDHRVAVLGDSHSNRIFHGLAEMSLNKGSLMNISRSSCPPLVDVEVFKNGRSVRCQPFVNNVFASVVSDPTISTVILTSFYQNYLESNIRLAEGSPTRNNSDNWSTFSRALEVSIERLIKANKRVVLLLDVPNFPFPVLSCIEAPVFSLKTRGSCSIPQNLWMEKSRQITSLAQSLKLKYPQMLVVDPAQTLCDGKVCLAQQGEKLLYMDDGDHLSDRGALVVGQYMAPIISDFLH